MGDGCAREAGLVAGESKGCPQSEGRLHRPDGRAHRRNNAAGLQSLSGIAVAASLSHGCERSGATGRKRSSGKGSSQKRDTVKGRSATLYAKRTTKGRFREMDAKSLAADRPRKAKTRTKSGFGDQGDRTT